MIVQYFKMHSHHKNCGMESFAFMGGMSTEEGPQLWGSWHMVIIHLSFRGKMTFITTGPCTWHISEVYRLLSCLHYSPFLIFCS